MQNAIKGKEEKNLGDYKSQLRAPQTVKLYANYGEINFIKNFFNHNNWKYQPVAFYFLDGTKYTPDFYDVERNTFIEVAATRQAYHINRAKYLLMKIEFPKINFEVRDPFGKMVEEANYGDKWEFQLSQKVPKEQVA